MAVVGDLLLACDTAGGHAHRDPTATFDGVRQLLAESDIVVGNLECTLPGTGETVRTEPRVIATPGLVRGIKAAGFHAVCLANNHAFDCLEGGFRRTRALLRELGIACFGAGENLAEASAPAVLEVKGRRLAFLGAVDERSGPGRFAGPGDFGVAPLDLDRLLGQVRQLRADGHDVIVSVHWGEERLAIPSPVQVEQARALADAGASLVLGHHPHVLQGLEVHSGVPIIYSLGNFVACEVPFTSGDRITWNRTERTGCVLQVELAAGRARVVSQIPTYDDGRSVAIDRSGFGDRRLARVNRALARGVTLGRYRREYFWVKTVLPALAHLRWSELRRLRLARLRKAVAGAVKASKAE